MRSRFLGHFKENDKTIKELWEKAVFVFDANVLLNLYRYSDTTRSEFLTLLDNLKSRSWLPEQAAHEFLENRTSVIKQQIDSYNTTKKEIDKLEKSFSGSRAHPFITETTKKEFEATVKSIGSELSENQRTQEDLIHNDPIKNQVADLFEGLVGDPYSSDQLSEIFKLGKERYESRIPPGYKDGQKHKDPKSQNEERSNFGDWIIWKQVMDFSTSKKTAVIFVTDDRKDDWWEEVNGKTLGPRPELIKEFCETTEQRILIYTPDSFLKISKEQLNTKISQKSIVEVKAEHQSREEDLLFENKKKELMWLAEKEYFNRKISPFSHQVNIKQKKWSAESKKRFKLSKHSDSMSHALRDHHTTSRISAATNEIEALRDRGTAIIEREFEIKVKLERTAEGDRFPDELYEELASIKDEQDWISIRIFELEEEIDYLAKSG